MGLEERPGPREGGAGTRLVRRLLRPSTVAAGHSGDAAPGFLSRGRARDRRSAASARPRASRLGWSLGRSWALERRARSTDAATRSGRAPPRAPRGPSAPPRGPARWPVRPRHPPPAAPRPLPVPAPPANGRPRRGALCALPVPGRLRARKADPTRRGRCSGPAAAAAAAASSPPDRVYCPNPKVQFCGPAAASERDDTGVRQVSEGAGVREAGRAAGAAAACLPVRPVGRTCRKAGRGARGRAAGGGAQLAVRGLGFSAPPPCLCSSKAPPPRGRPLPWGVRPCATEWNPPPRPQLRGPGLVWVGGQSPGRAPILLSRGGGRGGLASHPPPPPPLSRAALLFGTHSAAAKGEPSQVIKSLVAQPCRSAAC